MAEKDSNDEISESLIDQSGKASEEPSKEYKKEPENYSKNTKKRCLLLVSVVLNALILILNIITAVYMTRESKQQRTDSRLCVNCSFLRLHPDDDLSVFDIDQSNTCCVRDGGNMSVIVDRLVHRSFKEKLIEESRPFEPLHCNRTAPVIKMVGKLINMPGEESSHFSWLRWDLAFLRGGSGGITHDDTFITVGRTGLFLLYSQIVLHNRRAEEPTIYSAGMDKYFLHAIYRRFGSRHDQILLGGSYTYYTTKQGSSMITSYIGSPYQLRKGDRIGVKVHDVSQVVPSNLTNFFGVHLIQ